MKTFEQTKKFIKELIKANTFRIKNFSMEEVENIAIIAYMTGVQDQLTTQLATMEQEVLTSRNA